jgi:integrase
LPRRAKGPRLYLDPARKQWIVRDGAGFVRTGIPEQNDSAAQRFLARYIDAKHKPKPSDSPPIADMLNAYAQEHLPHTRAAANGVYQIEALARWWGDKVASDINARTCREYATTKSAAAARRDLETLRAAVRDWNKYYGPLASLPSVVLPDKVPARQRWLSRSEVAKLLWAARRTQHLRRFILLALYTGSRSGVILRLQWDQIDLSAGVMARIRPGTATSAKKRAPKVRLGKRILSHLRRWKRLDAGQTPYLCHYDGRPVGKMRRAWPQAAKRAGLAGVTPHTLRHTRATWLMRAGIDPWEAAGALGMTVEMIEQTYGHHHPDFQKRAAEV